MPELVRFGVSISAGLLESFDRIIEKKGYSSRSEAIRDLILSTMHLHLDHHNCLEVLAVQGATKKIREIAERLISIKGVKHGQLTITSTGKNLP